MTNFPTISREALDSVAGGTSSNMQLQLGLQSLTSALASVQNQSAQSNANNMMMMVVAAMMNRR